MTPEDELLDVIGTARARLMAHAAWRSGPARIYDLLQLATRIRQMEITALGTQLPPWETVLGLLIAWHHEAPVSTGPIAEQDAFEVVVAAALFARLDNLQLGTRMGSYRVRKTGDDFVVTPRWDPAIEVADLLLEHAAAPTAVSGPSEVEMRWITTKPASSRKPPPIEVFRAAAQRSRNEIDAWRTAKPEGSLPESFPLGDGLTIGHAIEVLAGIMGLADLCQFTASSKKRTESTLAHLPRNELVALICELAPSCDHDQVDDLVARLTYAPGRLTRNSPLVRLDDMIIICPPLIGSRLIDPIVLRSAGYDPVRFGPIGHKLGEQATGWARWLATIPGVLVAEGVKMFTPDGRQAGDLDIVAVDPVEKIVLCMEIKSPIDAWSLTEVGKTEKQMVAACRQLAKRRRQLAERAASSRFPRNWPVLTDFTWTWAVGMPQQVCLHPPPEADIYVTALRFALGLGEPPSLATLVRTLRNPTLPKLGVHFVIEKLTVPLEHHKIHVDTLGVYRDAGWRPTFG